jgi:UbiD family decarboxylase
MLRLTMQRSVRSPVSEEAAFDDLGGFIDICKKADNWQEIRKAHWDLEIGTLVEAVAERSEDPPLLLFDEVEGYPEGYRIASLIYASAKRVALALGLSPDAPKIELSRLAARRLGAVEPIEPREVDDGPVLQRQWTGSDIDLLSLPVLRFHAGDGGRYIGTGDTLLNRDPQSGYLNMGTYRMQVHEKNLLGLWMSPGQQGRQICERHWQRGESCPVVATFGGDPLVFLASHQKLSWGTSELAWAGGLRGRPVDVIRGPLTGLPIPAQAEVAIEGEVPPPSEEARDEGPFGEWPGYYSGGSQGTGEAQPVIRIKALYHREQPILHDQTPLWPGASTFGLRFDSGVLWHQLIQAGVQDVVGVYSYNRYFVVVAIKQRMGGHALQTAMAVLGSSSNARNGRYVVIVDEDIDPSNLQEVLWAMETRVDPASDIRIMDGSWSTPLDPRMPPSKRDARDYTNSRAVFLAVRPFAWRDKFPVATRADRALKSEVLQKFADVFSSQTDRVTFDGVIG